MLVTEPLGPEWLAGTPAGRPFLEGDSVVSPLVAMTVIVVALSGLASLTLILCFLWRVYERGGRADLTSAGKAIRDASVRDWGWVSARK